jgi:hypothetical protein
MDIDANDILGTNEFIPLPDLNPNQSNENRNEFREFYEKEESRKNDEKVKASINKIELKNVTYNEATDPNNLLNTNFHDNSLHASGQSGEVKRSTRDIKTLISIDSRDRIKTLYPKPNDFDIFLGKTYRNIKKIELISLEFPNTNAVINSTNNRIYWRNQEDIDDDVTVLISGKTSYPVYTVQLRVGSYTISSLQTEIATQLNLVKRTQGLHNGSPTANNNYFHYFVVNLDITTDIVTFNSLILLNSANNSMTTSAGIGLITVTTPIPHNYKNNTFIYMRGVKQIGGIPASNINGFQLITVTGSMSFAFTVTVIASSTVTGGGGNTIQSGRKAPFQLLWGNYSSTVSQNIGYPLENSSDAIYTSIISLTNIFQMNIKIKTPHSFIRSYDYIGSTINVGSYIPNTTNFIIYASFQITDVPDNKTLLVQVTDNTVYQTMIDNLITQAYILKVGSFFFEIDIYSKYIHDSFLIITNTNHNYKLSNITDLINVIDTADDTILNDYDYDGTYQINQIPSSTKLIVPGVIGNINTHLSGIYGHLNRYTPLTTHTVPISNIIINSPSIGYIKIITTIPHELIVGDSIVFNNVITSPPLLDSSYKIDSIIFNDIIVKTTLNSIDNTFGTAFIGTGLMKLSLPSHGFNSIINVTQGPDIPVETIIGQGLFITLLDGNELTLTPTKKNIAGVSTGAVLYSVTIQTITPHNLSVGSNVRITFSGDEPTMGTRLLTGNYLIYSVQGLDTFTIVDTNSPFLIYLTIPLIITGVIGLENDFILYGVEDIGGINQSIINSLTFVVRTITDSNNITFMTNGFAKTTSVGGGSSIYISSLRHGYNGTQLNTKNNILNRSINLEGENYTFLTCPDLNTMINTGDIKNIFARISLDQPPGYVCFKFLSNPKIFYTLPLNTLENLRFSIVNYNNSLYEFSDLDFSFCLEITEVIDTNDQFNISSRRGISDSFK